MKKTDLTVIIPVREGSSRIKDKIHLPFTQDHSLLEWKIEQVLSVHPADRILISSHSDRVREISMRYGVGYHERSNYLSVGHQASFSEVITGIVKDVVTPHFAWVTVVVPLMGPRLFREAFDIYGEVCAKGSHDSLVAVNHLKEYFWNSKGPVNYEANKNHTISQDLPDLYRVTNGLYMCSKSLALSSGYFLGKQPYKFVVPKLAGVDIDESEDYEIAKALLPLYAKQEK